MTKEELDLRKQYEDQAKAEGGKPIIIDPHEGEVIRTTGKIIYGWYCDGRPSIGWKRGFSRQS